MKNAIPSDSRVLLLGSGLTAVDVALQLWAHSHAGRITLLSRHGLLPAAHPGLREAPPRHLPAELTSDSLAQLFRRMRILANGDWAALFDRLRPLWGELWARLPTEEKRRFVRHLRRFWCVQRHRAAPQVHAKVSEALRSGALQRVKGRLVQVERTPGDLDTFAVALHRDRAQRLAFDWLINCTEPNLNATRSANPLIANLLERQIAFADSLQLGLSMDSESRVVNGAGLPQRDLFAMGPLTIGRFGDITAIPELREQANAIARRLLALTGVSAAA